MAARRLELDGDGCVAFLRCLYQAKSIVHQLEKLADTTWDLVGGNLDAIKSYVDITFNKFLKLLHSLLAILVHMESQTQMSKMRMSSFRSDLDSEWRHASTIYRSILDRIRHQRLLQDTPSPAIPEPSEDSTSSWSLSPVMPTH